MRLKTLCKFHKTVILRSKYCYALRKTSINHIFLCQFWQFGVVSGYLRVYSYFTYLTTWILCCCQPVKSWSKIILSFRVLQVCEITSDVMILLNKADSRACIFHTDELISYPFFLFSKFPLGTDLNIIHVEKKELNVESKVRLEVKKNSDVSALLRLSK